jgi:hypothetical protein
MKARLIKFGEIEVEGNRYTHDVVIEGGKVRKRKKGPSKQFREQFGHTPLSVEEEIPWASGSLSETGARNGEESRSLRAPTLEVCELLEAVKKGQAYAILHCTC